MVARTGDADSRGTRLPRRGFAAAGALLAALGVLAAVVGGGCTSARISSKQDYELGPHRYETIVVEWALADVELQAEAEAALCAQLDTIAACECLPSTDHFTHRQEIPAENYRWQLDRLEVDGIVTVVPRKSYFPDPYVPLSRSHPGYSTDMGLPPFTALLWSHPQAEVVWQANVYGGLKSERLNILDMSRKIARELVEEGIVAAAAVSAPPDE